MRIPAANALDLRHGRWQDALADVRECDALIVDPPYSARTHDAQRNAPAIPGVRSAILDLQYEHWTAHDARAFVAAWVGRVRGWWVIFSDHALQVVYESALEAAGLYVFAPIPQVTLNRSVRLAGDGPACWTTWVTVARPRSRVFAGWGALPGAYLDNVGDRRPGVVRGAKPPAIMRAIVRDYSRASDLVCDPCAGGGTTALACHAEGRRFVGAECDPTTYAKAKRRIDDALRQQPLPFAPARKAEQHALFDEAP